MSKHRCNYRPLIIIGSPRSGTNMLRDVLVRLPQLGTWPCDEINYIWRHYNVRYPSDEFAPDMARPEVVAYIRKQFDRRAGINRKPWLVEKTCANSLRVEFVDKVVPDARYLFICRDGIDVVASALKRWKAGIDLGYLLAKARFVPAGDLPYYAIKYLGSHFHRWFSEEKRHGFWGPRFDDMNELLAAHTLEEVCAMQWERCIQSSWAAFDRMSDDRYLTLRYEEFVGNSAAGLERICRFLGFSVPDSQIEAAVQGVSAGSVGKGRQELGAEGVALLESLIGETLNRYGYSR